MPTDEIANMWVQFKFSKTKSIAQVNKIKMFTSMNMIKGPLYIKFQLKLMQLEKELFTLEISRGTEVKIPPSLDQSKLPFSYRYFDPVINIVKSNLEGKNRDFAKLKKSISYAFDQKY